MKKRIFRQNKAVIFKQEGDEGIIFNPAANEILVLNTIACFIWKLCDGVRSVEEIARLLSGDFDAKYKEILEDAEVFLSCLEKKEFIQELG